MIPGILSHGLFTLPIPEGTTLVGANVITASGVAITFDFASLVGGLASAPEIGDYIMVCCGWSRAGTTTTWLSTIPVGLSSIVSRIASDTIDSSIHLYGGFYEAGTATGGVVASPGNASANMVAIYVFRGVDPTTPLDVTPTSVIRTNGCDITMPSITPVTAGAKIVCFAASASQSGANTYIDPAGFVDIHKKGQNGSTEDGSIIEATYNDWTSGPFAPGIFDFSGGDSFSSACGITVALRMT
jgi:hypothetical protein